MFQGCICDFVYFVLFDSDLFRLETNFKMAAISDHVTSVVWRSDPEVGRRVNLGKVHDFDLVLKKGKSD